MLGSILLVDVLKHAIDQNLSLRARDEHAGTALQHNVAKRHLASHVLQGLAGTTTLDTLAQDRKLTCVEGSVVIHVNLDARKTGGSAHEPLGRQTGMLVTMTLEIPAHPFKRRAHRPHIHAWPTALPAYTA